MRTSILVCLCAVSLAACSNGGSVTRSASSPTPDSGQPGQPNAPAFTPFSAASVLGDGETTFELDARTFDFGAGAADNSSSPASVTYNVTNGEVTDASFTIGGETYTIAASDVESFFDYYDGGSGAGFALNSPEGRLMIIGRASHPDLGATRNAPLQYMVYGRWQEGAFSDTAGTTTRFIAGQATPESGVPTSASARYIGRAEGTGRTSSGNRRDYNALVELNTDFADINMSLTESRVGGSLDGSYDASGTGTVTGADFAGTLTGSGNGATGNFDGRFYGPSAEEAGGTFTINNAAGGSFAATFATVQPD